jgi:hypothetical protein
MISIALGANTLTGAAFSPKGIGATVCLILSGVLFLASGFCTSYIAFWGGKYLEWERVQERPAIAMIRDDGREGLFNWSLVVSTLTLILGFALLAFGRCQ